MKNKLLVVFLALALVTLPLLCGACAAEEEIIELSYSNFFPATHGQSIAAEDWIEEIETRTNGRVKITYYPGGTLTPAPEIYDGVVKAISDIGMTCLAYTRGRFPLMEGIDLPLGYPSGTVATKVANDVYAEFKPEELADTHLLYLHAHGPGILHSKTPVHTLEDLQGMKIRCTGLAAKIVEKLGGVPVAMSQGETSEALAKGTVQGTFSPIEVLKGWKQADVIDYTTECYDIGYTTTFWVGMNPDKWNSLPSDIQRIFNEVSEEWIAVHAKAWDDIDVEGREYTLSLGNEIIPLSPAESARWVAGVKPLQDDYLVAMEAKGLPGQEFLDYVLERIKEYSK